MSSWSSPPATDMDIVDVTAARDGLRALFQRPYAAALAASRPCRESFLVAEHDRIAMLSITGKEWVKVSLAGDLLGRWNLPAWGGSYFV